MQKIITNKQEEKINFIKKHFHLKFNESKEKLSDFLVAYLTSYSDSLSENNFFLEFDNTIKNNIIKPIDIQISNKKYYLSKEKSCIIDKNNLFYLNNHLDEEIEKLSIESISLTRQKFSDDLFLYSEIFIHIFGLHDKPINFINNKINFLKKIKSHKDAYKISSILNSDKIFYFDPVLIINQNNDIDKKTKLISLKIKKNEENININYKKIEKINIILNKINQLKINDETKTDIFINELISKNLDINISYIFKSIELKSMYDSLYNEFIFQFNIQKIINDKNNNPFSFNKNIDFIYSKLTSSN